MSVIVVAFNSAAYLDACITSILGELGPDDQLIVVDNGSTDGSAEHVRTRYPQTCLIESENRGYAGGNNLGAACAHGECLVFLNPDTRVHPGALAALLAPLQQDAQVGVTTACIVYADRPQVVNTCGNTVHYTGLAYCRGANRALAEFQRSCDVDAVSGAAFAIRRDLFHQLGGFDERFFMYVEDTDLSWRARMAGFRCRYVAEALVEHDHRPVYSPHKAFYLDRNRHMMLLKNLGWAVYLRMLPALLFAELVTWGFLLLNGPRYWLVKPRVYRALWRERQSIRAARRAAQALRHLSDRELLHTMTYRLEFGQLAGRTLALAAGMVFHPIFWAAQRLALGGRA